MIIRTALIGNQKIFNYDTTENPLGFVVSDLVDSATAQLGRDIDTAAGNARAAFVSPGALIEQEYLVAQRAAETWLNDGADANAVPPSVQDHADVYNVTPQEAAIEIVATAAQWEQVMQQVRHLRMQGKAAVRAADTIDAAEQAAQQTIEQLNRFRPDAA